MCLTMARGRNHSFGEGRLAAIGLGCMIVEVFSLLGVWRPRGGDMILVIWEGLARRACRKQVSRLNLGSNGRVDQ